MSKNDVRGATVIISGASSGIGYELSALLCKKYGCRVIGLARNEERLNSAAREIGELFIPFVCDVTKDGDRQRLFDFVEKNELAPDILINNAGMLPEFACFTPEKTDELERVMNLNFHSHVKMCALFMPALLASGRGAIVNVASSAALATLPGTAAYSSSKSALLAFTEALALEYKGALTVCAVCPGMTATALFSSHQGGEIIDKFATRPQKAAKRIVKSIKSGRKKAVIGVDAHLMSLGNRLFGVGALKLFSAFIRIVPLPIFASTFYKKRK